MTDEALDRLTRDLLSLPPRPCGAVLGEQELEDFVPEIDWL